MSYLAVNGAFGDRIVGYAGGPQEKSWLDKLGEGASSLFGKAKSAIDKASPAQRAEWASQASSGGGTYVAPQKSAGISPTHILIGGVALVGLFLVLKKK